MPQINLSFVSTRCAVPDCSYGGMLHRHHMGCEKMFVRHFERNRKGTKKYEDFTARYWQFHPDDCVTICETHHSMIHALYGPVIGRHIRRLENKPVCRWSWKEAGILIRDLRDFCQKWLADPTYTMQIAEQRKDFVDGKRSKDKARRDFIERRITPDRRSKARDRTGSEGRRAGERGRKRSDVPSRNRRSPSRDV